MIYAIWHGGVNYATLHTENDVEQFDNVPQAADALNDRMRMGQHFPQRFRYVHRDEQHVLTPNVGTDSEMRIYDEDPALSDDPKPTMVLRFGPRGRIMRLLGSSAQTGR